jgi:phosphoglucomutase
MRFSFLAAAAVAVLPSTLSTNAFAPKPLINRGTSLSSAAAASTMVEIPTKSIAGMKPGTSGLRKKVEIWQNTNYVENFIQSLLDTAVAKNGGEMLHT